MRTRYDPQTIGGVAAVELRHEVEAVRALVERGIVPVRPAVLMPRDRTAEARLLDPHRLVEWHEVLAVDGLGDLQQLRMAIEPKARIGELQRAEHELHDIFGRLFRRRRFRHLHRMAPVGKLGTADRIGKRLDEVMLGALQSAPIAGRPWRSSVAPW